MAERKKRRAVSADDYIYASARIRAGEALPLGGAFLRSLAQAPDDAAFWRALAERRLPLVRKESGAVDPEATFDAILSDAYAKGTENVPDPTLFAFLRYPYDCHNLKSALKSRFEGRDPEALFLPFGTLSPALVRKAAEGKTDLPLSAAMGEAVREAIVSFARSADPQTIDLLLDRACYADMLAAARSFRVPLFEAYVREKIDLVNLLTCLRLSAMGMGEAAFAAAFLPGGRLSFSFFSPLFVAKNDPAPLLKRAGYAPLAEAKSPALREKAADEILYRTIASQANVTYGPEVIAAYLLKKELDVKNLRILYAARHAGFSPSAALARLREV